MEKLRIKIVENYLGVYGFKLNLFWSFIGITFQNNEFVTKPRILSSRSSDVLNTHRRKREYHLDDEIEATTSSKLNGNSFARW